MAFEQKGKKDVADFDVVCIGGGFSGLVLLHQLRKAGFSARSFEAGNEVGGVWHWNRYPGARCDVESYLYCYFFSEELYKEWEWSSRYPGQGEILRYINYVADKFDLRKDIQFNTRIMAAHFDDENMIWKIFLDDDTSVTAKYFIPSVGGLSAVSVPNFKGLESFEGDWYHTGKWPADQVDFRGKRVGVVGTGASGIQSIPMIAKEAEHLTVFQRTPQFVIPARNYEFDSETIREKQENYKKVKQEIFSSRTGDYKTFIDKSALEVTNEERLQEFEKGWNKGGGLPRYKDVFLDETVNEMYGDFIRSKISEIVKDPETANKLMPTYLYGTKRQALGTNYYETFNRENVQLVDVKSAPILEVTPAGIRTTDNEYKVDVLVFATGYDAITGSLFKIDIRGKNGIPLKEKWQNGGQISTYLGLATSGFPNMFMITGAGSPAALANNFVVIESNVEWIIKCIKQLRDEEINSIEVKQGAESEWMKSVADLAKETLFIKTDSWWTGANISGKPTAFPHYLGGFNQYLQICDEARESGYKDFLLTAKTYEEIKG